MVVKRSGLGRNLSALLSHSTVLAEGSCVSASQQVAIHSLYPGKYQPRGDIDEVALAELASSIKKQGLLQPLLVREASDGRYEIIAGERRWRACQLANLPLVSVIVHQVDDETAMAIALVENLQREDLNAMDEARAMHRLTTEFSLTHQQVAELLCKSRAAVSNCLRLLQLSHDVSRLLEQGVLDMGHARSLLMLDEKTQTEVAQWVVSKRLSVRETEALVSRIKAGASLQTTKENRAPLFEEDCLALAQQLKTKVTIKQGTSDKGTLIIHYENREILQSMLGRFLEWAPSE